MTREDARTAAGISLPGVVGIVFVILKLTDEIDWSWWWAPLALTVLLALIFVGTLTYKASKH